MRVAGFGFPGMRVTLCVSLICIVPPQSGHSLCCRFSGMVTVPLCAARLTVALPGCLDKAEGAFYR
jgi:hypothetical protein